MAIGSSSSGTTVAVYVITWLVDTVLSHHLYSVTIQASGTTWSLFICYYGYCLYAIIKDITNLALHMIWEYVYITNQVPLSYILFDPIDINGVLPEMDSDCQ